MDIVSHCRLVSMNSSKNWGRKNERERETAPIYRETENSLLLMKQRERKGEQQQYKWKQVRFELVLKIADKWKISKQIKG